MRQIVSNAAGPARAVGPARARAAGPAGVGGASQARGIARGNVTLEICRCFYKTFLNCNPHTFSGTEGVVGLIRWFKKLESVFWISKCADEDRGLPKSIQGNVTSSKPTTTHEALHMAHNLMDHVVRANVARGSDGNKQK
ncbi:hypothetical protein Tco_1468892 [Tanacetum coccineum]